MEERCPADSPVGKTLKKYQSEGKQEIANLFLAFYFKTVPGTDDTFEFTHKTFAEYLTACRIVNHFVGLCDDIEYNKTKGEPKYSQVLEDWLRICGQTAIVHDLYIFIRDEIAYRAKGEQFHEKIRAMQKNAAELIEYTVKCGMPCQVLGLPFKQQQEHARNAGKALLVIHSSLAEVTDEVSKIAWPKSNSAGEWITELRGQRLAPSDNIPINHIDFSDQIFHLCDLYEFNIRKSVFVGSLCYHTIFWGANLQGANFQEADLRETYLWGANLRGANLTGANLEDTIGLPEDIMQKYGHPLPDAPHYFKEKRSHADVVVTPAEIDEIPDDEER